MNQKRFLLSSSSNIYGINRVRASACGQPGISGTSQKSSYNAGMGFSIRFLQESRRSDDEGAGSPVDCGVEEGVGGEGGDDPKEGYVHYYD